MDIISPNRYANVGFDLYHIDNGQIKTYKELQKSIIDYENKINKTKEEMHNLIICNPILKFTESKENGSILEQIENKEKKLFSQLLGYNSVLEHLNILNRIVKIAFNIIYPQQEYISLTIDEKYEKAFNSIIYNNKNVISKNARYYLNKPSLNNTYDVTIPKYRDINDILCRAYDNIASNDYNDGRQISDINNIFNSISNSYSAYVIFIKTDELHQHLFVGNSGQWIFNTKDEAKEQLNDIVGVSYSDFVNYHYIKKHYNMFNPHIKNSLLSLIDVFPQDYFLFDIINSIYKSYYNSNDVDLVKCNNPINMIELNYIKHDIINRIMVFINSVFIGTEADFLQVIEKHYNSNYQLENPKLPDELSNFTKCNRLVRLKDIKDVIKNKTSDYILLCIVVEKILEYYFKELYTIKKIKF